MENNNIENNNVENNKEKTNTEKNIMDNLYSFDLCYIYVNNNDPPRPDTS